MEACPVCGGRRFVTDHARAEEVCDQCGLVRALPPVALPTRPTTAPTARARLPRRLAMRQRSEPGNVQRLRATQDEARRLADALGCPPDVAERAARILQQARTAGLTQGRPLDALAAAALLASCRMLLLARTEKDVAAASKATPPQVQAALKALMRGLDIRLPPLTAREYVGQVGSTVGLDDRVQAQALRLLQPVCGTSRAAGKSPLGWAAAALLLAARQAGVDVQATRLAQAAGIGTSTLYARVADLGG